MSVWTTNSNDNLRGDAMIRQVLNMPPRKIGHYQVLEAIGDGGMGTVYKCIGSALGEEDLVAIKLFKETVTDIAATREAMYLSRLDHPNVARFRDYGVFDGHPFVVMRLYPGGNLSSWLAQCRRPWSEILPILEGIARGLRYIHLQGILHLDVKPHNILFDHDGFPRLGDFGISALAQKADTIPDNTDSVHKTKPGTKRYASPEQLRGDQLDARSDQYSFCRMLKLDVVPRALDQPPRRVLQVIDRGTAEEPGERFESMSHLLQTLTGNRRRRLRNIALASIGSLILGASVVSAAPSLDDLLHPCQPVSLAAAHWADHKQAVVDQLGPESVSVEAFLDSAIDNSTRAREELCGSPTFADRHTARYQSTETCLAIHDQTIRAAVDLLPGAAPKNIGVVRETLEELTNEPSACLRASVGKTPVNDVTHPTVDEAVAGLIRAQLLNGFGNYEASRHEAKSALVSLGNDSRTGLLRAQIHLHLGQTLTAESAYPQAMFHLREAETIATNTLHFPLLLDTLNGMLTVARRDTSVGKTTSLELIGRTEQVAKLVDDPQRTATYLNLRGGLHYVCDEPPELALQEFEKALRILDSEDTPAFVLRSQVQSNIAAIHLGQGQTKDAATLYESIVAKRDEMFGTLHPQTNSYRHNYANALHDLGRYELALHTFLDVIDFEEQASRSPLRILVYAYPDALASARGAGSLELADILATQLADLSAQLDGYHREATALALAEHFAATGQLDRSFEYLCTAVESRESESTPFMHRTQLALADALLLAGARRQAAGLYREVLESTTSDDEQNHAPLGLVATTLLDGPDLETIARAENLADDLHQDGQHVWAARALGLAAESSRALGDTDQAQRLRERALQIFPNIDLLATPAVNNTTVTLPCATLDAYVQRSYR